MKDTWGLNNLFNVLTMCDFTVWLSLNYCLEKNEAFYTWGSHILHMLITCSAIFNTNSMTQIPLLTLHRNLSNSFGFTTVNSEWHNKSKQIKNKINKLNWPKHFPDMVNSFGKTTVDSFGFAGKTPSVDLFFRKLTA